MKLAERIDTLRSNIEFTQNQIDCYENGGRDLIGGILQYEINLEEIVIMRQNLENMESLVYDKDIMSVHLTKADIEFIKNALYMTQTSENYDRIENIMVLFKRAISIKEEL